jgi:hypothetical protein
LNLIESKIYLSVITIFTKPLVTDINQAIKEDIAGRQAKPAVMFGFHHLLDGGVVFPKPLLYLSRHGRACSIKRE